MSDKIEEAFAEWAGVRYSPVGFPDDVFEGFSLDGFRAGAEYQRKLDLDAVTTLIDKWEASHAKGSVKMVFGEHWRLLLAAMIKGEATNE